MVNLSLGPLGLEDPPVGGIHSDRDQEGPIPTLFCYFLVAKIRGRRVESESIGIQGVESRVILGRDRVDPDRERLRRRPYELQVDDGVDQWFRTRDQPLASSGANDHGLLLDALPVEAVDDHPIGTGNNVQLGKRRAGPLSDRMDRDSCFAWVRVDLAQSIGAGIIIRPTPIDEQGSHRRRRQRTKICIDSVKLERTERNTHLVRGIH